jgi:hypothetical protein
MKIYRRSDLLKISGLIRNFDLSKDYSIAINNFEILLKILEGPNIVSHSLSTITNIPLRKVRESAISIIDRMIFNEKNDPFLSLGLCGSEDGTVITKRWKQLITLFHPDKYPGDRRYEERAKRINEAYEEIRRNRKTTIPEAIKLQPVNIKEHIKMENQKFQRLQRNVKSISRHDDNLTIPRFLRLLPFIILIAMLFFSLISIILLIKKL